MGMSSVSVVRLCAWVLAWHEVGEELLVAVIDDLQVLLLLYLTSPFPLPSPACLLYFCLVSL